MSLPFFRLPSEIRNMVYELLFQTPRHYKTLTPDPSRMRRRQGARDLNHRMVSIGDGLPFLRTCQQVHEEVDAGAHGYWMHRRNGSEMSGRCTEGYHDCSNFKGDCGSVDERFCHYDGDDDLEDNNSDLEPDDSDL
ncbi:hypothetical protein MMC28_003775 [Mycoblastus sanguinarius]|nr:hypothetical protein [Mycoblastus sanguinarius]